MANRARLATLTTAAHAAEFGKILLALSAIIVTIIDRDTKQFELKPVATTAEIVLAGVVGAAAFVGVAWNRGKTAELGRFFAISAGVFAIIQIIFELSGFNSTLKPSSEQDTGGKKMAAIQSKKWIWAIVVTGILIAICIMICAHDWPPENYATGKAMKYNFTIELFVMGLSGAIPAILVAWDRDPKAKAIIENVGINFVVMGVIHTVLQLTGFYRYLFTVPPKNV